MALSTSCRSTRHTTSKEGIGGRSIGGRLHDVNSGGRAEAKEARIDLAVALLVGERDARRRPERIRDPRLLDRSIPLPDGEPERPEARVVLGDELQDPAVGVLALERRVEVAVDAPEAGEERDRGAR